jgi:hypothetical protein
MLEKRNVKAPEIVCLWKERKSMGDIRDLRLPRHPYLSKTEVKEIDRIPIAY